MPGSKSIAIIGEGETEWFYFDSLRVAHRLPIKLSPQLPSHPDIASMMKTAERCIAQEYDHVVCVVDMDRFHQFPADMQRYRQFRASLKFAQVGFIETYPCTEFWFLLHVLPGPQVRHFENYDQLLPELRKYIPGYEKSLRFFRKTDIYRYLSEHGDLGKARANAERLSELSMLNPQDRISYSEIYKIFSLLEELTK